MNMLKTPLCSLGCLTLSPVFNFTISPTTSSDLSTCEKSSVSQSAKVLLSQNIVTARSRTNHFHFSSTGNGTLLNFAPFVQLLELQGHHLYH